MGVFDFIGDVVGGAGDFIGNNAGWLKPVVGTLGNAYNVNQRNESRN